MDSSGLQTLITLTPLGAPPQETPRVFAITPIRNHVDVGRASKNESKGLVAAKDNAWFDSPIMSRQHARFDASTDHKTLWLRDNGSTHGTSVGGRRLPPQVDYALINDEIITFGARVTSGELSYPAREFRVNFECQPWSPEPLLPSSDQKRPESIRFQVPDEDNDSVSDQSHEDSVRVLDFARTYSVPSSDDDLDSEEEEEEEEEEDEDEEDEDDEEEEEQDFMPPSTPQRKVEKPTTPATLRHEASRKPGTTPEHPIEVWAEPSSAGDVEIVDSGRAKLYHGLTKGISDNAGSSDMNPIDLVGEVPNSVSDHNSEDEGPEILSSKKMVSETFTSPVPSALEQNLTSKPIVAYSYSADQPKERQSVTDRDGVKDNNGDVVQSKAQSQAEGIAIWPRDNGKSTISHDDFDQFLDHSLDHQHSVLEYHERAFGSGSTHPCARSFRPRVVFDLREVNGSENTSGSSASRTSWSHSSSSSGIGVDVSQEMHSDVQRTVPRPPSPSDAALAKNANTSSALHGQWPFLKAELSQPGQSDSPYVPYLRDAYQRTDASWPDTCSMSSSQAHDGSIFEGPESTWHRYEDGPFVNNAQHNMLPTLPCSSRQNTFSVESNNRKITGATPQRSTGSADNEKFWAIENPSSPVISDRASMQISEESEYRPRGNESHPPRLNISDIVNPLADTSRSLKRKADDMSVDDTDKHDAERSAKFSQQVPQLEVDTQETDVYFDDAQPREDLVDGEHNLLQGSSIEPTTIPCQTLEVALSQEVISPTTKKRKVSSSSAVGVGRFVSGVLVGLAGAFAAFIATIPMSVQEEALHEYSKVA